MAARRAIFAFILACSMSASERGADGGKLRMAEVVAEESLIGRFLLHQKRMEEKGKKTKIVSWSRVKSRSCPSFTYPLCVTRIYVPSSTNFYHRLNNDLL